MAKGQSLTKCEIRWDKRNQTWFYRERVDGTWRRGGTSLDPTDEERPAMTKADFIKAVIGTLKANVAAGAYGFSLRICNKNGQYAAGDKGEKTIPKSADPKRSKG